tara:strand:+ start:237 stop:458 length:222 start_codon:yes stop_codon:yes gene_type:complete
VIKNSNKLNNERKNKMDYNKLLTKLKYKYEEIDVLQSQIDEDHEWQKELEILYNKTVKVYDKVFEKVFNRKVS